MSLVNNKSISIIGLGPMGQAMANVYLDNHYSVTLWNRTADKAKGLIKKEPVWQIQLQMRSRPVIW